MAMLYDDAPTNVAVAIVLAVLALISFTLRVWCRFGRSAWGADDWIMTFAVVPFFVTVIGFIGSSVNGIGSHLTRFQVPEKEPYLSEALKYYFIFQIGYILSIIPIKLSISWMLIRIAEGRMIYILLQYVVMALIVMINFLTLVLILTNCKPIKAAWNLSLYIGGGGYCRPLSVLENINYVTSSVNIATDWITALMPIPLIWNVQLNLRTKILIVILMGLGVLASVAACVRLGYSVKPNASLDFTYITSKVCIWSYVEDAIGMLAGNVATLRPLFRRFLDRAVRTKRNRSSCNHPSAFGPEYELPMNKRSPMKMPSMEAAEASRARDSLLSDADSLKQIIHRPERAERPGAANIMVSRQVNITYE
ncbi:hypothetical protein BDV28DRAFT_145526 [Aspergillus coremiiformis]|uniref:Rhodopsin domain-containing protein n=1 Tax=Aspergillus coremiiformis TaxID=138285 RepID=A0A5N6ZEX9_9EURO|nr:hypothetical protein BDV28DRAFT_145526 [Aspergillus coremiiformis]